MADTDLPSAIERVFAITELAEALFLYLHPSDLLTRAQQVCKLWLITIAESDALQKVLFMRPIPGSSLCYDRNKSTWRDYDSDDQLAIVENPFAFLLSHPRPPACFTLPNASWRSMLLTQPPVRVVCFCSRGDWSDLDSVARNAGVQLGDLGGGPVYGITGSSTWLPFQDHAQLVALNTVRVREVGGREQAAQEDSEAVWENWLERRRWMCCSAWNGCI